MPSWLKEPGHSYRMINAKSETLTEKPAYRNAYRRRRCLIPADGFYEWHKEGSLKQPYFIRFRDHSPMFFAGLWEHWQGPEQTIESCTIVTTRANATLQPIHHRMPAIIAVDDLTHWLDPMRTDTAELNALLQPFAANVMEAYRVDPRVNKPINDDPGCIEPSGEQGSLF
jgi:putative SOS response-associated peptidase YedK